MPEPSSTSSSQPHRNGTSHPIRIAIAGLGRSGWNIHAKALRQMPKHFRISAAMDPDAPRREQAAADFACPTYETFEEMLDKGECDVMAIASPSHLHAEHSLAAIDRGLHVVTEKPFATTVADAERMIEAARVRGVVLAPFQNRRFESHYRKVAEILDSGVLGDVLLIRMCWHRFTRRWDWQTSREFGGGALFNNGVHLLDQALPLLGESDPEIFLDLRRGLSMGDAEEHMKLILRPEHGPTIDIEYSNAVAYEHDRWQISGTSGGLVGTPDELRWRTVDWNAMPERAVDLGPAADRKYPSEQVIWNEHTWKRPENETHPYNLFYLNLHDAIRKGTQLVVTPESALRYMHVLERCQHQLEHSA